MDDSEFWRSLEGIDDLSVALVRFYERYRAVCRPPMQKLDASEMGELWFHDCRGVGITVHVGAKSLLVAYDGMDPADAVIDMFRDAVAWLRGGRSAPPKGLHLKFAAHRSGTGAVCVRHACFGDWAGLPYNLPLPPSRPRR